MSASTTRQVRHKIPLPLSIVARPHEAGPILSWRADSLALVWLDSGITPCCKTPITLFDDYPARRANGPRSPIDVAVRPLPRSPVSSSLDNVVPQSIIRSPRVRPGEFVFSHAKRLLQQNQGNSGHRISSASCPFVGQRRTWSRWPDGTPM